LLVAALEALDESPPFDFAQGRLSRKIREKWGPGRLGSSLQKIVASEAGGKVTEVT